MNTAEIDFVITWVDGNDPEWQKEKNFYLTGGSRSDEAGMIDSRFREWDLMRFWFRGIEKFTPWVRKIYFVTWGHTPKWLNLEHPKLHIVNHKDFIPDKYLPTFNSHTIEFNIYRIEGLSEQFVYLNDDMFITNYMSPGDFFVNDLPCDYGMMECLIPRFKHTTSYQLNALSLLNEYFNMKSVKTNRKLWFNGKYGLKGLMKNLFLSQYPYFVGFKNGHLPLSYLKSTFIEIWEAEGKRLEETTMTKFRTAENISIWVARYWQLAKGQFSPVNPKARGLCFHEYNDTMIKSIVSGKYQMVCINDLSESQEDFEFWQPKIRAAFEKLFPKKSEFEK